MTHDRKEHRMRIVRTRRLAVTAVAGIAAAALVASAAVGGTRIVDNETLNPPAPTFYTCTADGSNTICRGTQDFSVDNEPIGFDCGGRLVYGTGSDIREVSRYYDENGNLAWRRAHATATQTWSLSPTGAEPALSFSGHWGWTVRYGVPGDLETGFLASHGTDFRLRSPANGVIVHSAGTTYAVGANFEDLGIYHGLHPLETDFDATLAKMCSALGV
jgi:hypothetical protein